MRLRSIFLITILALSVVGAPSFAAVKPAAKARVGDQCLREGVTAPGRGISGTDLVCMKATLGSSKGELLWWYPSLKPLNIFEIIAPIISRSSDAPEVVASRSADRIGQAIGQTLKNEELVKDYSAKNFTGGYGAVAFSTFLAYRNRTATSFIANLGLLSGLTSGNSKLNLLDSKPIAHLLTEYEAIVVPVNSKYTELPQLVDDLTKNNVNITFVGGPSNGTDNYFLNKFLKIISVPRNKVTFQSTNSGYEVVKTLLSDKTKVGISSNGDFVSGVNAGKLRVLGIASPTRLSWIKGKTLQSQNVDLVFGNWYGLMAPSYLSDNDFNNLLRALEVLHNSKYWNKVLNDNYWSDDFLYPDDFKSKIVQETQEIKEMASQ